jgi:hypothetical protein
MLRLEVQSLIGIFEVPLKVCRYSPALQNLMKILAHIQPILQRLSTLHDFTIESQVQFHAPLAFTPVQTKHAFGITPEDLTVFVNSAEWTLCELNSQVHRI